MPIYEYRCNECGEIYEIFQKVSDSPPEICSKCQGRLSKLISSSAFILKGSGWYLTDYARKEEKHDGENKGKEKAEEVVNPVKEEKKEESAKEETK